MPLKLIQNAAAHVLSRTRRLCFSHNGFSLLATVQFRIEVLLFTFRVIKAQVPQRSLSTLSPNQISTLLGHSTTYSPYSQCFLLCYCGMLTPFNNKLVVVPLFGNCPFLWNVSFCFSLLFPCTTSSIISFYTLHIHISCIGYQQK